jgi:hypothetical protein
MIDTYAAALELRQWQREQREFRAQQTAENNRRQQSKKRAYLDEYKTSRGCGRCGVLGLPPEAYDFHHRDPHRKHFNLSRPNVAWHRLRMEVTKCDVLCANCHRIVEAEARQALTG